MSIETAVSREARAHRRGSRSLPSCSHAAGTPSPAGTVGPGPNGTITPSGGWRGCLDGAGGGSSSAKNSSAAACPLPSVPHTTQLSQPGFKRSLQHLDEKELRWRCASEGQIGLLER